MNECFNINYAKERMSREERKVITIVALHTYYFYNDYFLLKEKYSILITFNETEMGNALD